MNMRDRGPRSDGEATRQIILETAGELFAERGLAETPSKAIAVRAGTNIASINYHFADRDGLYRAVLLKAHDRFINVAALRELADTSQPPRTKLHRLLELLVGGAVPQDRWHAKLLSREILSPSSHMMALKRELQPKFDLITTILSQISGIATDDPRLPACLVSVVAPCAMLLTARNDNSLSAELFRQTSLEELSEHLATFAFAGLEAVNRRGILTLDLE
jgi:TetR/AcrR family transcriptional regulator, regulator of cefoperazone and chloramphenicol sensitivity